MAFGIDGVAMSGALTAGGQTVGVLGCGADIVYPLSNKALFADVEQYGCIISEFPPGTPPARWNFPRRNRIISGLSNGVLVVEAPAKSGALITASLALEQGRDVFVVPGNIDVPSFVGSNRLLRDGAILAGTGWDILCEYEAQYPDKIRKDETKTNQTGYFDEVARIAAQAEKLPRKVAQKPLLPSKKPVQKEKCNKNVIDNGNSQSYSDNRKPEPKLNDEERLIYDSLRSGERLVDDVIAETGISAGKMLSMLTLLELRGVIMRLPGKRIRLK
jgi:DNA processing protein